MDTHVFVKMFMEHSKIFTWSCWSQMTELCLFIPWRCFHSFNSIFIIRSYHLCMYIKYTQLPNMLNNIIFIFIYYFLMYFTFLINNLQLFEYFFNYHFFFFYISLTIFNLFIFLIFYLTFFFITENPKDWSDHALWWPKENKWLTRTRSTLDQVGVHADCLLHFTPMHKILRVQVRNKLI